jgi:hypothetical protein
LTWEPFISFSSAFCFSQSSQIIFCARFFDKAAPIKFSYSSSASALASRILFLHPRVWPLVEFQKRVNFVTPITHVKGFPTMGLIIGIIKVHDDDPIKFADLLGVQVILGNKDIGSANLGPFPARQPHVRFGRICTFGN